MSAIGGIVDFKRGNLDFTALNRMRNALSLRGRAGSSAYLDMGVGIFNCSDGVSDCAQPIVSERRGYASALSLDSRSLEAYSVLEGYRTSGVEVLGRLCGDFAIALYDAERRMLMLARDKRGARPLFFFARGGRVYFSSEAKGLLALENAPIKIRREHFSQHLTSVIGVYGVSDLYYGISELEAGECILFTEIGCSRFFYQQISQGKKSVKEKRLEDEMSVIEPTEKSDEDTVKNALSDALIAFDMPQFDAFMPCLCNLFSTASKKGKRAFEYLDPIRIRGPRYAYDREDRLSSFYGVVGFGEYPRCSQKFIDEQYSEHCVVLDILTKRFFELDSREVSLLRCILGEQKSECVWRFLNSKGTKKEDTELKIRTLGMLCQTVEWSRLWELDLGINDNKIYSYAI